LTAETNWSYHFLKPPQKGKTMFAVSAACCRFAKLIHRWTRVIAYDDMARQASDWIPEELRIERTTKTVKPIALDFDIPKKHRLEWIRRSMHHLPH